MKRHRLIAVLAAVAVALGTGCAGKKEEQIPPKPAEKARIAISGSDTTYAILKALSAEYVKAHPEVSFDFLPSSHTLGGIKGVANKEIDLGATSRAPLPEEEALGTIYYEFARDGLPFFVNQNNPLGNITTKQLKDVYAGKITKWSQLGVKGMAEDDIVVIDRPPHSSARMVLDQILFGKDFPFGKNLVMVERASDAVEAIAKTPNVLGYTSQEAVVTAKLPLKALKVDGIEATFENIKGGAFIFMRPFGVVYRPDAKREVMDFVEFIKSPQGKRIIQEGNLVQM